MFQLFFFLGVSGPSISSVIRSWIAMSAPISNIAINAKACVCVIILYSISTAGIMPASPSKM